MSSTYLYAPAHRAPLVRKALSGRTGAVVIVDLEDGVPLDARAAAEATLRELADAPVGAPATLCRVRAGRWREADLAMVPGWFDGVVLAKAEDADDVTRVGVWLDGRPERREQRIWLLVESARGVEELPRLLGAAGERLAGVMVGAGDLAADLGLLEATDGRLLDHTRARIVVASAAAGVTEVVDTPEAQLVPDVGFRRAVENARALGFTGKAAIHPDQLPVIEAAFAASPEQVAWAHAVLAAEDGAQRVGGRMVDEATKRQARHVLSRAPGAEPSGVGADPPGTEPRPTTDEGRPVETFERDEHGRYLEEFEVGELIHHWPGRTISSWENQQFTLLTGNSSSGHLDLVDAQASGHPDMVVNGGYLLALTHGLSTRQLSSAPKTAFFVGMTDVRIMRATYPGDTLRVTSKVLDKRESTSHPDKGILTVETWAENQHGERVIEFKRAIMVFRQGQGPGAQPATWAVS